jgi:hypothetical protein
LARFAAKMTSMTLTGRGDAIERGRLIDLLIIPCPQWASGFLAQFTFLFIFIFLGSSVVGDFVRGCVFDVF